MRSRNRERGDHAADDVAGLMGRLTKLSARLQEARREIDRARGRMDSLLSRMRSEFGAGSPDELREEVRRLSAELERASSEVKIGVRELEDKYGLSKF